MTDTRAVLTQLDLTESEIDLYMALLREGEGTASHIAKQAGVGRRLAYDRIQTLQEKGLVSYIDKDNKRIYKPTSPERLEEMVEDRKEDLKELESKVNEVLPELSGIYNAETNDREVKILEGKSGIKQLFNDELRHAEDTIYLIGSPIESKDLLQHFLPSWSKRRSELGIEIRGVFEHSMRGKLGDRAPTHARFLPEDQKSKVSIAIYGDRAGIVFWIEDPLVIMIEDPEAAESFKSYFHQVWESSLE